MLLYNIILILLLLFWPKNSGQYVAIYAQLKFIVIYCYTFRFSFVTGPLRCQTACKSAYIDSKFSNDSHLIY